MRRSSAATAGVSLLLTAALSRDASAHRRDEYLQAARVALAPDAVVVEIDLTPGVDTAESIVAAVDRNGDGVWSADERQAYARHVVSKLGAALDGSALALQLVSSAFPDLASVRRGEGGIRIQARAPLAQVESGSHEFRFRHARLGGSSVYLANALVPESPRLSITEQRRDRDQTELTIAYTVRPQPALAASLWVLAGLTAVGAFVAQNKRFRAYLD